MIGRVIDTRWLTQASFELVAWPWGWSRWRLAVVALMLLLVVVVGRGIFGGPIATTMELSTAHEQQARLVAEVERLGTQLAVERATRSEIEQHAAELSAQVAELDRQVEFLTARKAPGARAK